MLAHQLDPLQIQELKGKHPQRLTAHFSCRYGDTGVHAVFFAFR